MSKYVLGLLLSLMLVMTSTAHSKGKAITILAPITCVEWLEGHKAEKEVKPMSFNTAGMRNHFWLLGLITGLNANLDEPNLLAAVDSGLVIDWMDRFCSQNQGASVFEGAEKLLAQVSRRSKR